MWGPRKALFWIKDWGDFVCPTMMESLKESGIIELQRQPSNITITIYPPDDGLSLGRESVSSQTSGHEYYKGDFSDSSIDSDSFESSIFSDLH